MSSPAPAQRLGPYELVASIGKGGMGEVWRARDTRLNRDVAIKFSNAQFTDRFQREAQAIAALNHPNICTLHDVGPNYLVMELIEGSTLAERIKEGPLPLDEALNIARQIADALDAAHEKGIVHRDLKPGNIKIRPDGSVKVLDFGLAKSGAPETTVSHDSPTLMHSPTLVGVILGTAAYMAPEQARGKTVDKRADIWAFGVVLYEMLTRNRLFEGEDLTETLASVVKSEPNLAPVPREVRRLLDACLRKDPKKRLRDIGDWTELLDQEPDVAAPSPARRAPRLSNGLWIGAAVAAVALGGAAGWMLHPKPAPARAARFTLALPENVQFNTYLVVSPDGHKIAFAASGENSGIWVRDLDTLEWRRLQGTENGRSPFWSPDSRFLAFAVASDLRKIDVAGGPPQLMCTVTGSAGSGAWGRDGVIVFGSPNGTIRRISAPGCASVNLTAIDRAHGETTHGLPSFLPDGKHFLYVRGGPPEIAGIYVGSIDKTPAGQSKERIIPTQAAASYVNGSIFFLQQGTLMTQPFDAGKLKLTGEPVPLAEHVGRVNGAGAFSVSPAGVLAYRTGSNSVSANQATWLARDGKISGTFGQTGPDQGLVLSPDGSKAAGRDAQEGALGDIWLLDFTRGVRTRLTFRQSSGSYPVWSPDGARIAFAAGTQLDTIFEKSASGAGEEKVLYRKPEEIKLPTSWSRDGHFLLFFTNLVPKTGDDLWVLSLEGERKATLLLGTTFDEFNGAFSPDGRWVAYVSNESGRNEVYVRPFVASGPSLGEGKWQISRDGAASAPPRWRGDGKELIFVGAGSQAMAVDVSSNGIAFAPGTPHPLFKLPGAAGFDMTADGKRFLVSAPAGGQNGQAQTPITVVLNWQADLKK